MRWLIAAMALALLGGPAALAQETTAVSSARALIAASRAEGVFEPLPGNARIVVRHVRSGLVCRLGAGATNRLLIFPQAARGEDVACETKTARESVTLYATRYSFTTTLDEQIEGAAAAIRRRFPDAQPIAAAMEIASDTLPPHRSAQFIVSADGARTYTRASVAQIGGWTIKLRYSLVAPDDRAARDGEVAANLAFAAALRELAPQRP